jgi:hypothetical protein
MSLVARSAAVGIRVIAVGSAVRLPERVVNDAHAIR